MLLLLGVMVTKGEKKWVERRKEERKGARMEGVVKEWEGVGMQVED